MPVDHLNMTEGMEIPDCPGYRATPRGNILHRRGKGWRRMSGYAGPGGYIEVKLRVDGKRRTFHVHRLILETFVGPRPEGMQALHDDGNPANNRLDNLSWGTPQENADDTKRHGRTLTGEKAHAAKLTDADVETIRLYHHHHGMNPRRIAELWNISRTTAAAVCEGESWRHIPIPPPR